MKPAPFAYAKARSVADAVKLLGEHSEAKLLAGGQSLMATLNMRLSAPSLLIDLNGISGLDTIAVNDGVVEIGALARHAAVMASDTIAQHAPLIAMAMPQFAIDTSRTPAILLLVDQADISGEVLRPMVKAEHVSVRAYRRLRWAGRTGLLLEAA